MHYTNDHQLQTSATADVSESDLIKLFGTQRTINKDKKKCNKWSSKGQQSDVDDRERSRSVTDICTLEVINDFGST